jgi:hypothetical protein
LPRSVGVRMKLSDDPDRPTAQNRRRHIWRGLQLTIQMN